MSLTLRRLPCHMWQCLVVLLHGIMSRDARPTRIGPRATCVLSQSLTLGRLPCHMWTQRLVVLFHSIMSRDSRPTRIGPRATRVLSQSLTRGRLPCHMWTQCLVVLVHSIMSRDSRPTRIGPKATPNYRVVHTGCIATRKGRMGVAERRQPHRHPDV